MNNKPLNGKQQTLYSEIIASGPLKVDWQGRYWLEKTNLRVDGKVVKALLARGMIRPLNGDKSLIGVLQTAKAEQ